MFLMYMMFTMKTPSVDFRRMVCSSVYINTMKTSFIEAVAVSRTKLTVGFHVTGTAKGHEVASLVCTAVRKRNLVMHLLGWLVNAELQAFLTHGMLLYVAVTDTLPGSAVAFLCFGVTAIVVVLVVGSPFVCGAVKLTVLRKVGTAGHTARSFRSCRHIVTSFWA